MTTATVARIKEMTASYRYSVTIEIDRDVNTVRLYNNHENTREFLCVSDKDTIDEVVNKTYMHYKTLEVQ